MEILRLKERLKNREMTIGSWITMVNEACAEIMARAGFEWLVIDMEHSPIGVGEASRLIRIIDLAGVPALCRLPSNDPKLAKNVLDAGAAGIIVPMVGSREEAVRAVEAAYYPPKGGRGVGLARAQGYGSTFEEYRSRMDQGTVVVAMIEDRNGIENAEGIAATPGIDGLLIGPYDISASLGLIGNLNHKDVGIAVGKVMGAAARAGKGCGLHVVHPEEKTMESALRAGYTFLALGADMIFLDGAAKMAVRRFSQKMAGLRREGPEGI